MFPLEPGASSGKWEQGKKEIRFFIERVERLDGKADRWAPKYLVQPKPLTPKLAPQNRQVIRMANFGSGKPPPVLRYPPHPQLARGGCDSFLSR